MLTYVPRKTCPLILAFLFFFLGPFCSSSARADVRILFLNTTHSQYQLGGYYQILEDSSGKLSIADVSSENFSEKFITQHTASINKGLSDAVLWIRFSLQAVSTQAKVVPVGNSSENFEWLLYFGKQLDYYDEIDVFWQKSEGETGHNSAEWQMKRYGMYQAIAAGARDPHYIKIVLDDQVARACTIYLRVNIKSGFFVDPTLYSPDEYEQFSQKLSIFYGGYYGLVLSMIVYNLFLFFFLGDKVRLLFISYAVTLCCYFLLANELGLSFIPTDYLIATRKAAQFLTLFSIVQILYFSIVFLDTKENVPFFHRLMQIEIVAAFVLMIAMCFFSYFTLLNLVVNFASISFISILLTGIAAWVRGYRPARFFVMAWVFFISGGLIYTCTFSGIFPYPFFGNNAAQLGSGIEMLLLSLAIADRMKFLFERLQGQMFRREKQLNGLTQQLVRTEERERRRMAGILHDSIGQILVASKWEVKRLLKAAGPALQNESMALSYIESCIQETRSLTTELYPRLLYQIGLGAGLESLADEFSIRFNLKIEVDYTQAPRQTSEEQRLILYRSVSELLNNTGKHSKADRVTITLAGDDRTISVVVYDNGVGSNYVIEKSTENDGFGLFSIRERLQHLGGSLTIDSPEGGGFRVSLRLPLINTTSESEKDDAR